MGCGASAELPPAEGPRSSQPNLGFDRETGTEVMLQILAAFETQANWQALHDFDVVASGIFGWKQTVHLTGRAGHDFDVSFIVAPKLINMNRCTLACAHATNLGFFEVCGYPDVVESHDRHKLLTGLHALSDFDGLLANYASERGNYLCVA